MELAIGCLKHGILRWHLSACLYIVIYLVVETALQFGAHTSQLLRVERDILVACGIGAYTYEVLHPGSAAELSAARTGTADTASLLTCTNLLHLDTYMEGICKHLDELAEIHTLICDIVEDSLVAIALILHVTDFHLQTQVFGYLTALDHGVVFAALGFLCLVEVHLLGKSVDALDVILRLEICLLDLQFYQSAG